MGKTRDWELVSSVNSELHSELGVEDYPEHSAVSDGAALTRNMSDRSEVSDILSGHISRTVWTLSWPSAIAFLLQTVTNLVDRYLIAKLGSAPVAALGLSQNLFMLVFGTVVAISAATTALVARFTGARESDEAVEATRQSMYFAALASVVFLIVILFTGKPVLSLMAGRADHLVEPAWGYLAISALGMLPLFGMTIIIAAFRGAGDMLTPVKMTFIGAVLTALLDWFLIFGRGPFPAMGLNGAATAGLCARSAVLMLGIVYLYQSPVSRALTQIRPLQMQWVGRILRIGVPAGLQTILRSGASLVYLSLLGRLSGQQASEAAIGALTIGLAIEAIAYMPGFAFSAAAAAVVGQNLGAGQPQRASQGGWACARQSVLVMAAMAAVFFVFAGPIVSFFTQDAHVRRLTISYLRVNAISEPFIGLTMTLSGALQGAGDTRSPTVVTLVTMWLLRLPLTYWLCITLKLGATAAWWAMAISMIASGIIISGVFARGKWRDTRI